jgi:hypothetical protein
VLTNYRAYGGYIYKVGEIWYYKIGCNFGTLRTLYHKVCMAQGNYNLLKAEKYTEIVQTITRILQE